MDSRPAPDTIPAAPPSAASPPPAARPAGMGRLGAWLARRRLLVLLLTVVALALAVPFGADVEGRLSQGGNVSPGSESARADELLNAKFEGGGSPHLVFVAAAEGSVDTPAAAQEGRRLTQQLSAERGVAQAASYWSLGNAENLRAKDGRSALIMVRLSGSEDEIRKSAKRIIPTATGKQGPLKVTATGATAVRLEIETRMEEDLARTEMLTAPLTLIILLLVFGGVVAATMPLAVGVFAVIGSFVVLRLLDMVVSVSVFSVNVTTVLGLGLAIDYSLFIITRYREELAAGRDTHAAIAEAVRTAGRTVVFSAVTVALSLSSMLVFPMYQLRSFAYAGLGVVALAAIGSVIVLPALLAVLGRRIDSLDLRRLFRRRRAGAPVVRADHEGFWHRLAVAVMRRPLPFALVVAAFLVTLGLPFLQARFGDSDDRVLPSSSTAYQGSQMLREQYGHREGSPVTVVLPGVDSAARSTDVAAYAKALSKLKGVTQVEAATGFYAAGREVAPPSALSARFSGEAGTWLSVISDTEPYSRPGLDLVGAVRAVEAPADALVGGQAALLTDSKATIADRLPWALGIMAASTLILLFLFTGSLLIPVKAIVLNLLSLSATFGAMVFIFQQGHLRWLVGDFTVTGLLDMDTPVLMLGVAFGLSMDYEVFLLSRIREEYQRTGDNTAAVALGLERTGRLVTAAAALLAVIMLALATSGLTPLKLLGFGMALAVIVDATLVRGILVPAFMRLAGRANWWAPKPLARLHKRFGLAD